ncbi:MAG: hypothetical protein Q8L37_04245 [Candidatus Gottesmanbacteria bacterium]|nr:hypothetical protein [Candidatus Gottesmanbacteria bacterium]
MVFAKESLGGAIGGEGLGPFGTIGIGIGANSAAGLKGVTSAVSAVIGIMTVAAGIWFMFQVLTGGLYWITSAGDKAKLSEARDRIQNAAIGLIVVVAAWSILALAGQFLGYDIVINDPDTLFKQLKIQ